MNGEGLEKDVNEAVKWFRLSAAQGHTNGQKNLAQLYEAGIGVAQDFAVAAELYEKAVAQFGWATPMNAEMVFLPMPNALSPYIAGRGKVVAPTVRCTWEHITLLGLC